MPNIKSAKKRMKQAVKATVLNRSARTRVSSMRRKFFEAVAAGEQATAKDAYSGYCSVLDRAAKHGVIAKNTAVRRKARAANQLRAISA